MNRTIRTQKQSITVLLIGLGCLFALWAATAQPNPNSPPQKEEVLNNAAIIDLKQLGLGESVIVEKIRTSPCNFDLSVHGLKQLKAAGVSDGVISAMLAATSATKGNGDTPAGPPGDSNDPKSPHEAGIWLYEENSGKPKMIKLEPSVYSQMQTGSSWGLAWGGTMKSKAVIRSAHAECATANRQPAFYFYFEHEQSGLSDSHGATTPNEYILAQFEVKEKDNQRSLVMSSINAYSGGQSGAESKSVRSFDFQKLAPATYKVTPKENLAEGEYGFFYGGNTGGGKVFDFGVKASAETEPAAQAPESKNSAPKP
jgi:hypothetical protein